MVSSSLAFLAIAVPWIANRPCEQMGTATVVSASSTPTTPMDCASGGTALSRSPPG
jgi:hypothetical protein